jgi:hypothetical protein
LNAGWDIEYPLFMIPNPNDYELQEEYDLYQLAVLPKGRYAPDKRKGKNVVVLDPDIAQAFPSDKAVNDTLRLVIARAKIPRPKKTYRHLP